MITLLIRTSYRPAAFKKCIASIDYPVKRIVSYDDQRALQYLQDEETVVELGRNNFKYGYNLYLNALMNECKEGHMLFADDDDFLIAGALKELDELIQPGISYIVPFLRDGKQKPWNALFRNKIIETGCIGLPCLILWHEHRKYVRFDETENSDYKAIKDLSRYINLQWVNLPVVNSPVRNWGKME